MNILFLYNATQTYTNTVFEHIGSFEKYSTNRIFYCHHDQNTSLGVNLSNFDAVAIHYSIRLPYDQISEDAAEKLAKFQGLKFLFIQDEYDHTYRAWHWIHRLGINLVFTVVPTRGIEQIYPPEDFQNVRFVSNLTGYVPDDLSPGYTLTPPSKRDVIVGYRGRPLPLRYGSLGFEKVAIGKMVKQYCTSNKIASDIAWSEEARIYGPDWYKFMTSCRAMLGSESGSNLFDWDGHLDRRIQEYKLHNTGAMDEEIYKDLLKNEELNGLMNQASPRIFEAISARTVLVLFEGKYSGVVKPDVHFIPLKKDGTNLSDVFEKLNDSNYVDSMAEKAYKEVLLSGKYSYKNFVNFVDDELLDVFSRHALLKEITTNQSVGTHISRVTTSPIRAPIPGIPTDSFLNVLAGAHSFGGFLKRLLLFIWSELPESYRASIRPSLRALKNIFRLGKK